MDSFCLSINLLNSSSNFDLDYSYQDVEFYIFNKEIFKLIDLPQVRLLNDIKTQLVPLLINKSNHDIFRKVLQKEDFPLRIYSCLLESNCYKIDCFTKLIGVIYEIQKGFKDIQQVFFVTENNQENFLNEFRNNIYFNMQNGKNPLNELPNELKIVSMDSYVAKPIEFNGIKSKITKSIIGKNMKINDGSKIQLSLIMDNCLIGKE